MQSVTKFHKVSLYFTEKENESFHLSSTLEGLLDAVDKSYNFWNVEPMYVLNFWYSLLLNTVERSERLNLQFHVSLLLLQL